MVEEARKAGRAAADEQANKVSSRSFNEMTIAMHQAGLSSKTIAKVHTILAEAVIPKVEGIRDPGWRNKDDTLVMQDADTWMRMYCDANGLDYLVCEVQ